MFLQKHKEALCLVGSFQIVHFNFLDALDYLRNHSDPAGSVETTIPPGSTSQDHSKWSILSRLGDTFLSISGGVNSGGYRKDIYSTGKSESTE